MSANRNDWNTRGAGMDQGLHDHAAKAAREATKQFRDPFRAYNYAAGAWCPDCGETSHVSDNGKGADSYHLAYCCEGCGHQWTPMEG